MIKYTKRCLLCVVCILLLCAGNPVSLFAGEYYTLSYDMTLSDGDVVDITNIGAANQPITIKVSGKVYVKRRMIVMGTGDVTFEGIDENAELIYDGPAYSDSMLSVRKNGSLTLKNITVRGDANASAPVISVKQTGEGHKVYIGENTCIDAGAPDKWAVGCEDEQYNSSITIDSTATVIGTVSKGVNDLRTGELTLSSELSATKNDVEVGDTVTVTGLLKPSFAADLTSASMELNFDNTVFSLKELSLGDTLSALDNDKAIITSGDDSVKVSFNGLEDPLHVSADGLEMFTATFRANQATEAPAVFKITKIRGSQTGSNTDLTVNEDYPSVPVAVTEPVIEATYSPYGSDYYIIKYGADVEPAEGNAYFLNGQEMTLVPAYSSLDGFEGKKVYVLLTTSVPDNLIPEEMAAAQTAPSIDPASGDANRNGEVNVVDAQVAYYMLSGDVTSTTEGLDWLNADVNGDGVISALDYRAIQYYVHYGEFGQFN